MPLFIPRLLRAILLIFVILPASSVVIAEQSTGQDQSPADKNQPGLIRLSLPPVLYAVVGMETNVYFDNVVLTTNINNYAFDVSCSRGLQQSERWTYIPKEAEIGRTSFQIDVRNEQNQLVARAYSRLQVVPAAAGHDHPVSLLMIGDSLTHASSYSQHLIDLCAVDGNPKLTLVGSHGPGGKPGVNRHEGYGGWTALRFATHYRDVARTGDYKLRGSPFLYKDTDGNITLDFKRYCADVNNGQIPDFVTIFLGPNDVYSATDETIEERVDTVLENFNLLIGMIHQASKNTKIGLMLPVPPAASQNAFGSNYKNNQTRWQYKRNQHRLVERILEKYQGRQKEGIHIVPTSVNLDCQHNYPAVKVKRNSRSPETVIRQSNSVHPSATGYQQIGDTLYSWLKAELADK